ncbi:hypothetical protein TNCV_2250251 [Trichonephila clavipes]|nr:hypothetical protein TNCV_2250251 [Trichonephila clavipes]
MPDRIAGRCASRHVVVIIKRLNRDSSLKMTRLQSVTLFGKIQSALPDVGSVVRGRRLIVRSVVSFMVSLDGTGCLEGEYSILFVCATKVRLSKQQDEDHERYERYPTHVQSVIYPANTQAKEEAYLLRIKIGFDSLGDMWTCILIQPLAILAGKEYLGL